MQRPGPQQSGVPNERAKRTWRYLSGGLEGSTMWPQPPETPIASLSDGRIVPVPTGSSVSPRVVASIFDGYVSLFKRAVSPHPMDDSPEIPDSETTNNSSA